MTVFAPKQEHLPGGGLRTVPLFPELRPYLEEAFDMRSDTEHLQDWGTSMREGSIQPTSSIHSSSPAPTLFLNRGR